MTLGGTWLDKLLVNPSLGIGVYLGQGTGLAFGKLLDVGMCII
jgi:hypothetical protein